MNEKKAAVIIGVDKTGSLPVLSAAAEGAREFASWATNQGFDVALHSDKNGPVTVADIKSSINRFVDAGTYSQLIVFFAGHGILKSANDEQWLLSKSPDDINEAVNVLPSKSLARNVGIPHIIFISDACRSVPQDRLITQVTGSIIFPNRLPLPQRPEIDSFYATIPGNPALEVAQDVAVRQYRGIFTSCILQGLQGNVPGIITQLDEDNKRVSVVQAYELWNHLQSEVPKKAEDVNITLSQFPDGEITSRPPKYLSKILDVKPPIKMRATRKNISPEKKEKTFDARLEAKEMYTSLIEAKGRESFETRTGFTIFGLNEFTIVSRLRHDIFLENGVKHVRIHNPEPPFSVLLKLPDGSATPLAVLENFVGTVVIENGRVINVNYAPSLNSPKYNAALAADNEIKERRAALAAAAHYGRLRLDGSPDYIVQSASYMRMFKEFDPTLGLYAAYAYQQAGNVAGIRSIFSYMRREPEPILSDVTFLTFISTGDPGVFLAHTSAPFCPMFTQGWSFVSLHPYYNRLKEMASHIRPGLWTTFEPTGVAMAESEILKIS